MARLDGVFGVSTLIDLYALKHVHWCPLEQTSFRLRSQGFATYLCEESAVFRSTGLVYHVCLIYNLLITVVRLDSSSQIQLGFLRTRASRCTRCEDSVLGYFSF